MEVDDTIEATTYSVVGGSGCSIAAAAAAAGMEAEVSMTWSLSSF